MALKVDHKYNGTVRDGSGLIETNTGTLGFQIMLECEDGKTFFVVWLTDKNKARAKKVFTDALNIPEAKLQDAGYIEYSLPQEIVGHEVTFGTKEEEYKGKTTVKVAWLAKRSSTNGANPAAAAASFFGGVSNGAKDDPITDDDIPF